MAGERSSVTGGLLAFFAGYIGVYFSGIILFPSTFWDLLQFSLAGVYGSFWNFLGFAAGAGVLLLSYPLAAGKWIRGVTLGLLALGALETISGFYSWYSMTVVGGVLALAGSVFGGLVWRAAGAEKPPAEVEAVEKPKVKAKAEKPLAAKKPTAKARAVVKEIPPGVPRSEVLVSQIEGIGPVYGSRLEKAKVSTLSDLAKASVSKVASAARINKKRAEQWIRMAKILLLESLDEEAAELLVLGAGVKSPEDLARRNADNLYDQITSALKMGKVEIPKSYRFTKKDVEKWINAAKKK